MMINTDPSRWKLINAFYGIYQGVFWNLRYRAFVSGTRMYPLSRRICGINDLLPTLAEKAINQFHFGILSPEHPNSIRHVLSPISYLGKEIETGRSFLRPVKEIKLR